MSAATVGLQVPGPVPREVQHAVALWIASIIVGLVGGTLSFVLANPLAASRQRMQATTTSGLSPAQLDTIRNVSLVVGAVFGVVFLALEVFFVAKMRAGRNWARIVLTVWFGLGVVSTLLGFVVQFVFHATPGTLPITVVVGVLTVVLLGAAVRLMYRPAASAYFTPPQASVRSADLGQQPYGQQPYGEQPYGQLSHLQQGYGHRVGVVVPSSYAWWPARALGGLVDHGVPTVIFFVFYLPFGFGTYGMGGNQGLLIMLGVIVVLIVFQVWNSAFRQGSTGQSWGKQVAKTRLIDEWTGRPLGAGRAFLRLLAHLFDSAACYLGWLFPIWDRPKRQTFADKIMHTIVVPAGEPPQPP